MVYSLLWVMQDLIFRYSIIQKLYMFTWPPLGGTRFCGRKNLTSNRLRPPECSGLGISVFASRHLACADDSGTVIFVSAFQDEQPETLLITFQAKQDFDQNL